MDANVPTVTRGEDIAAAVTASVVITLPAITYPVINPVVPPSKVAFQPMSSLTVPGKPLINQSKSTVEAPEEAKSADRPLPPKVKCRIISRPDWDELNKEPTGYTRPKVYRPKGVTKAMDKQRRKEETNTKDDFDPTQCIVSTFPKPASPTDKSVLADDKSSGKKKSGRKDDPLKSKHRASSKKKGFQKKQRPLNPDWVCKPCNKVFGSAYAKKRHDRKHDPKAEKYVCSRCRAEHIRQDEHDRHVRSCTKRTDWKCSICEKPYKGVKCMQKHMLLAHDEEWVDSE